MPQTFADNVVIITGASAGIGRELAVQLAAQGARLALGARSADKLAEVAAACRAAGGHALAVPTDVGDEDACRHLIEQTVAEYGRIDTLINNAGASMWALLEDVEDLSIFERLMRVNYLGAVYCTYFALPYLRRTRGRIVGVSSVTGLTGVPTRTGYSAAKFAMRGFFDSLRIELMGSGVTVTTLHPDFVATDIRRNALGKDGQSTGHSGVKEGDIMTAEQCAALMIKAIARRRRWLVMGTRAKASLWGRLLLPWVVDRVARRAINKGR